MSANRAIRLSREPTDGTAAVRGAEGPPAFVTVFFVLTFNFFLFRVMPGDPVSLLARSERLTPADVAEQRKLYGLDEPLPAQYVTYLRATLTGQLGVSSRTGEPVASTIGEAAAADGAARRARHAARHRVRRADRDPRRLERGAAASTTRRLLGSLVLYSVPEGWLGMLLLIVFAGWLGWFPAGGYTSGTTTGFARVVDVANHLVLPLLTLTLGYIGEYVIIMRSSLLEVMNEDFLQTARAKGVPERLVRRDHAVRERVPADLQPHLPELRLRAGRRDRGRGGVLVAGARPAHLRRDQRARLSPCSRASS